VRQSRCNHIKHLALCRNVVSATPRQLESLIRLSEALARMELLHQVKERHVQEALRLMKARTLLLCMHAIVP
jgi:DNA replicative helicase MCM subunit Mcm2 (Cdc46/Mcm family)